MNDAMRLAQQRATEFNLERRAESAPAHLSAPQLPSLTDDEREVLIRHHADRMKFGAASDRRAHWERMRDLINGRSHSQVEKLERSLGLRT